MDVNKSPLSAPRAKRQKIDMACKPCRTRKVKCDGLRPTCSVCLNRDSGRFQCQYTGRRNSDIKSPQKYVVEQQAGYKGKGDLGLVQRSHSVVLTTQPDRTIHSTILSQRNPFVPEVPIFGGAISVTGSTGGQDFSRVNRISPFTRQGSSRVFKELPSKSWALGLVDEAFKGFLVTYPIFERQSFMQLFKRKYADSCPEDPGWWASINVVFALAYRFRAMRTTDPEEENSHGRGYIQNAASVISELTMLDSSLPAIQALLGMAVLLQGTQNPRQCCFLISTTIRLAQAMGLHRRDQGFDPQLTNAEMEQRRRVFWIAYFMDKDISLRMGLPPAQDDDDMDAEVPFATLSDLEMESDPANTFNFFNCRIMLATIQGQVYKRLYSVKATHQSEKLWNFAAFELDMKLAAWRNSISIDFQIDESTNVQAHIPPNFLHKIVLRSTYFSCLISIQRCYGQRDPLMETGTENGIFQEPKSPLRTSVTEARKLIQSIRLLPQGDYHHIWLLFRSLSVAIITLMCNIIRKPSSQLAQSDLQLIHPFLKLFELLSREGKNTEVQRMLKVCKGLNRRANDAVDCVSPGKRHGGNETLEEFIKRVERISGVLEGGEELATSSVRPPIVELSTPRYTELGHVEEFTLFDFLYK